MSMYSTIADIYNPNFNPSVAAEFSTAAFRFGHSQSENGHSTSDEQEWVRLIIFLVLV